MGQGRVKGMEEEGGDACLDLGDLLRIEISSSICNLALIDSC